MIMRTVVPNKMDTVLTFRDPMLITRSISNWTGKVTPYDIARGVFL